MYEKIFLKNIHESNTKFCGSVEEWLSFVTQNKEVSVPVNTNSLLGMLLQFTEPHGHRQLHAGRSSGQHNSKEKNIKMIVKIIVVVPWLFKRPSNTQSASQ